MPDESRSRAALQQPDESPSRRWTRDEESPPASRPAEDGGLWRFLRKLGELLWLGGPASLRIRSVDRRRRT